MNPDQFIPQLRDFFLYREEEPLLFTGAYFWIFFTVFLAGYSLVYRQRKWKHLWSLLFSLFFYYKSSGWAVLLLLFTITQDYLIGRKIGNTHSPIARKWLVSISIVMNLLVLAYFKYAFLLAGWISGITGISIPAYNWLAALLPCRDLLEINIDTILLPAGISFFLFHSISYTVDVYRKQIEPLQNWTEYAVFVSFFPELVAGPIVRAKDFVHQLAAPYALSRADFGKGVALIMTGLFKKIVLSDVLSTRLADKVFDEPALASVLETWLAVLAYAFQIFCDFSGYTDIAIGLALLLGYHLLPNFDEPYKAVNITDFWRRWHISLSSWLKDYLYIPLGGNRNGKLLTYFNLLITMLLGGLWHGASLKFLLWGGLHGAALALHKGWMALFGKMPLKFPGWVSGIITFFFVALCWIPFRADDLESSLMIGQKLLLSPDWHQADALFSAYAHGVYCLLAAAALHFIPWQLKDRFFRMCGEIPLWLLAAGCIAGMLFIFQFSSGDSQPFIYFQF